MSLHFILGASGSGKSHALYENIIQRSIRHPETDYLILAPEQFTMQTQKELVDMHPNKGILNIDVLSFQRLAFRALAQLGEDRRKILEETGKSLALQKVAQENLNQLTYLGGQMKKQGYVQEIKSLISEFMQYGVSIEQLNQMIQAVEGKKKVTAKKLQDIALLYEAFHRYLEDKLIPAEEVLDALCPCIHRWEKIKNCEIVLDGFTGFTPVQNKLLEKLLGLCPHVWVTVTLGEGENPHGKIAEHQLFALSKKMIATLCRMARRQGVEIEERWIFADGQWRFKDAPALDFLEREIFRFRQKTYEKPAEEIRIFTAQDPKEEMEEVGRRILRLVREKGFRFGDIAVIAGDLASYGSYARQAMEEMEIPCFLDEKHTIWMNPYIECLRAVVDLVRCNYSYESVFRYLRCGMSDLQPEECDMLENYALALGIRGFGRWQEKWVRVYRGMPPEDIEIINELRLRFLAEVEAFTLCCKAKPRTVESLTRGLYAFGTRNKMQEKLKRRELLFRKQGNRAMEKEYSQIYGIVMSLMEKMIHILGEEPMTVAQYQKLLEAGLTEAKVALIPPSGDQVLVGDMERTRLKDIKALFFVGVNDQTIPKNKKAGGILSEQERLLFEEEGLELSPSRREAMYIQKFYLYLNMTKPSRYLTLSYSRADGEGKVCGPAYLIDSLRRLFPALSMEDAAADRDYDRLLEHPSGGIPLAIRGLADLAKGKEDDQWRELFHWYCHEPAYEKIARQLADAAFYHAPQERIGKSVARALYGESEKFGPTRLEQFAACAFAHYVKYGLGLRERIYYEFQPMDQGNVMHKALELYAGHLRREKLSWTDLSDEEQKELVDQCVDQAVADYGGAVLYSSARNEYRIARIKRILRRTVWALREQIRRGGFAPAGFEVEFPGGRIDRMDLYEDGEKTYVKIIDYKTGRMRFDLTSLYYGLQLQLAAYLNGALELERKRRPGQTVEPAGIFYYNIQDPLVCGEAGEPKDAREKKILKELRMNGLASDQREILEKLDATGETIPVKYNKDGTLSKASSVASQQQFGQMMKFAKKKMRRLAKEIMEGEAAVRPYELGNEQACAWCPYQAVCGFDEGIKGYERRRLRPLSPEECWKAIEEECEDENGLDDGTKESH